MNLVTFYQKLIELDKVIQPLLETVNLGDGLISINGEIVDTNTQQEMLSNAFLQSTTANPTCQAWWDIFKEMDITKDKAIPLFRDIPFRTQNKVDDKGQKEAFAQFFYEFLLPQQWTNSFPNIRHDFEIEIHKIIKQGELAKHARDHRHITTDPESNLPLESGGYHLYLYTIEGIDIWVRQAEDNSELSIQAAVQRTINENVNTHSIVTDKIIPMLNEVNQIAFNIRGLSTTCTDVEQVKQAVNMGAGGGHQSFLLLDRTQKTIYAINDTLPPDPSAIEGMRESYLYFKKQVECFLKLLGDEENYELVLLNGRSRQQKSLIEQPCSVSQYFHYLAIDAGVEPKNTAEEIPHSLFTLLYLLQYASANNNQALNKWLLDMAKQVREKISPKTISSTEKPTEIILTSPEISAEKSGNRKQYLLTVIEQKIDAFQHIFVQENHKQYEEAGTQLLGQLKNSLQNYEQDTLTETQLRGELLGSINQAKTCFVKDPDWSTWLNNLYIWMRDCLVSPFSSNPNLLFNYKRSETFKANEALATNVCELITVSKSEHG